MNNEPVAKIRQGMLGLPILDFTKPFRYESYSTHNADIPLYTHPAELTDEEIHQAIRRGFARDGFLSDGIFLEIKELLRKPQETNSEQVPDFFFMENDLMGKR